MTRFAHIFLGVLVPTALTFPHNTLTAHHTKRQYNSPVADYRAQAVVDAFRVSWDGYYKYAFPNDELHPVTNSFSNSR